jgi:uncharacterized protein (TIGR02271 family)
MMATTQRSTVVGVFRDRNAANRAVEDLRRAGFRDDQIGVASRAQETGAATAGTGDHVGEGAGIGVAAGAGVGALWALGMLAGLLPAVGPIVAGGILGSVLASAAGTAVVGGIVGALIGLGLPEEEAKWYESEFRQGGILVTVRADGRYDEAYAILSRHGAYDMHSQAARTATAGTERTIQVRGEELEAHKQPVQAGEVRVGKEVHTEHRTVDVPVKREEVVVERRPVSGNPPAAGDIRPGQEIRVPVTEEQVRVEKRPVVKEEVHVGKREVTGTEQVSGTVRKEEVKVEREGDAKVRGNEADRNRPKK